MKTVLVFGTLALVAALVVIFNRSMLAGTTITTGDVAVTQRNEPLEIRLFWIGGVLGGVGLMMMLIGVAGSKRAP